MANIVWHTKFGIELDLTRDDLGHEALPSLWETLYQTDRLYAARNVPVAERGLQCGGVCRKAGVTAWMYLRMRANGRREAVHERAEDEDRHHAALSDEHKAYQERIVRAAESGGFAADNEVRTSVGPRSWIQTDTLVQGEGGLRIGWEVQLSTAGVQGPRSVRARASRAAKHGITPAWHTDRGDYASRNDVHWTRSDHLPARVIAKAGDLRVVSGFRVLDFWKCDVRALYRCPDTQSRCGKTHTTPKPRDVFFDDLVRKTAAGLIVPVEFRGGSRTHRFWVTDRDRDRYADLNNGLPVLPSAETEDHDQKSSGASRRAPTCRPHTATPAMPSHTAPLLSIPAQAAAPRQEVTSASATRPLQPSAPQPAVVQAPPLPDDLRTAQIRLHQATAELVTLGRSLPWSVDPHDGWPGNEHPRTGAITGGKPPSPGWTVEQKAAIHRLRQECLALSETVATHTYWQSFSGESLVQRRMELKAATRTETVYAVDVTATV
ncbi:hypothetical protein [Streptomyces sp. NPDC057429]|uniref:hypothetical protein n=1 Tax=Streptomyces sp. NPDC057429 TaxID=3346130 RepID=UPI0036937310